MKDIRLVLPSFGCIVIFALFATTGCNEKSAPSPATTTATQAAPKMKMTTDIPAEITTPDSVETRIGTLKFFDGVPDDKTTELLYNNLDFMRGVQAFLRGVPGASVQAFLPAAKKFGGVDGNVMIFEDLMDSKALWLTPNNSSVYFFTWIDTTNGPIVMETPPNVLGVLDDHWFRWIGDFGDAGQTKARAANFCCFLWAIRTTFRAVTLSCAPAHTAMWCTEGDSWSTAAPSLRWKAPRNSHRCNYCPTPATRP